MGWFIVVVVIAVIVVVALVATSSGGSAKPHASRPPTYASSQSSTTPLPPPPAPPSPPPAVTLTPQTDRALVQARADIARRRAEVDSALARFRSMDFRVLTSLHYEAFNLEYSRR